MASEIERPAKIITWLVDAFAGVVNGIASACTVLVGLFAAAWDAIKCGFVSVFDWIANKIDLVVGSMKSVVDWVGKVMGRGSAQITANTHRVAGRMQVLQAVHAWESIPNTLESVMAHLATLPPCSALVVARSAMPTIRP
ncbi:hypothetical protein FUT69_02415 [Xylella taiwanensis]|uniref:Uncharacterized protein n=1 Tax=Xylella taiwanensis TaxID=1444770 RepID=Z9JMS9_9GAMM|nr:hypothetical protein [Xylella taiwanensis]AXI84020.1 hypothetical protein AB672_08780 [Xylella taiwanensis]EWS79101.1 hypothetical protein AF72_02710 [Xylella taiwanensis]MCD8457134.1 hypothetical protein [Xylella taiwanensis]MCD8459542.1 hypothetical protein [Xylella taiwanensis]MCD8461590.1 hypothetical protein [Xylella taiwanensis]